MSTTAATQYQTIINKVPELNLTMEQLQTNAHLFESIFLDKIIDILMTKTYLIPTVSKIIKFNPKQNGWIFSFKNFKPLGRCTISKKLIELSYIYTDGKHNLTLGDFIDTILHEIAHAIQYSNFLGASIGHDKIWKGICRIIGAKPLSTAPIKEKEETKEYKPLQVGVKFTDCNFRQFERLDYYKLKAETFKQMNEAKVQYFYLAIKKYARGINDEFILFYTQSHKYKKIFVVRIDGVYKVLWCTSHTTIKEIVEYDTFKEVLLHIHYNS